MTIPAESEAVLDGIWLDRLWLDVPVEVSVRVEVDASPAEDAVDDGTEEVAKVVSVIGLVWVVEVEDPISVVDAVGAA